MPETLPTVQSAIITLPDHSLGLSKTVPMPELLEDDMVLVKTVAVGLNPTDFKMPALAPSPGAIDGCDFAGVIVERGPRAPASFAVGDRVFGVMHGSNPRCHQSGAFAEYIAASTRHLFKMPAHMAWETAAALGGVTVGTVGMAFYCSMHLDADPEKPAETPFPVLVYGGSSATGTMAIQILKLSGLTPITTCSPHNFALVRSYGAAAAFDYRAPACTADIRAFTRNALRYALDCITTPGSQAICYGAIGRAGGRYTALEQPPAVPGLRRTVASDWVMGIAVFGHDVDLGRGYKLARDDEAVAFGLRWVGVVQRLVDQGKLRVHPVRVMGTGLERVPEGLEMLKKGKVSGQKLVYYVCPPS